MSHIKPDPVEALHAALLCSGLKIAGAARAIGRSPGVLYNKFSETMPDNEITAREALALAEAIESTDYVEAVCAYFGGVFFRVPEGRAGEDDVLGAYLDIVKRMGILSSELTKAREDGQIDRPEFLRLTKEGMATIASISTMLAEIETTVVEETAAAPVLQMREAGGR